MKKTLIKITSIFIVFLLIVSSLSITFAMDEYKYYCEHCNETVTVTSEYDTHEMFCKKNKYICELCGETIYGSFTWAVHQAACTIHFDFDVKINNNTSSVLLNYGDTLKLTATTLYKGEPTEDISGAQYKWTANSSAVKLTSFGNTCEVEAVKTGTATITVIIVADDGTEFPEYSDSQKITVKVGFFEKIISFFKNLFGIDRTIIQSLKN